jgi:hypothetical protein
MLKKIVIYCGLYPTFLVEGNAKIQLEVSENKDVIFFPIQVHRPLEIYPQTSKGSVDPRLRTPGLAMVCSNHSIGSVCVCICMFMHLMCSVPSQFSSYCRWFLL